MNVWRKQTINRKLTAILMFTSTAAMLAASAVVIIFYLFNLRNSLYSDLLGHAEVISQNCRAALAFNVPEDAQMVISTLSSQPSIVFACILDQNGDIFAEYRRPGFKRNIGPIHPQNTVSGFREGFLHVVRRFSQGEQLSGAVYIQADLNELYNNLKRISIIIAVAILIGLIAAYVISLQLQRLISQPILSLAQTAKTISNQKDYSVRAMKDTQDEIGQLVDDFNEMLFQIQTGNEALHESEVRYRRLVESLERDYLIYSHNTEGVFTYVSPSVTNVLGYTQEEFLTHFRDFLTDNPVNNEAKRHTALSIKGEKQPPYELEIYHKNNSRRFLEVTEVPIFDDKENVIAVEGIAHDITAKNNMIKELRETREQYYEIFNSAADCIVIIDEEDKIIDVNEATCKTYGYKREELIGRHPTTLITPEYHDEFNKYMKTVKETGEFHGETVDIRKDGSKFNTEVRGAIIHVKGKSHLMAIVRDVSERKMFEEERIRLSTAIEQAAEHIIITDQNGSIQYVNPAFVSVTGYSREEAIGQNPNILKSGRHDNDFYNEMWNTIISGRVWNGHIVNKKKDGTIFNEQATISPVKNPAGNITNFVAVKRDVTQQMKLEQQILQSQKMESIGTLSGGIAHDFNNILSAIFGFTELAIDNVREMPGTYSLLREVIKAADRAKDLVRQILTFSRKTEIEKTPLNTIPMVKEVCKFLRSSLPATIEIRQDITTTSDCIMADPTQFHQVLMNLCTNAGHAMKEKGGVLEVLLSEVQLEEEDMRMYHDLKKGLYLHLTVKDTGHGISKENLDRIFDPYFTTKEKEEGTGLGLSVVHGIVKDYGGDIRVYSEVGKGTEFHLYFPLIEKTGGAQKLEETVSMPTGTETILYVDDEMVLVKIAKAMLERLGYTVTGVTDPLEAIDTFESSNDSYDLVITDKTMPNMTGFDLARAIKKLRPDIPIILCTGFVEKDDSEKVKATGISDYITKPIKTRDLAETVRRVLDKK